MAGRGAAPKHPDERARANKHPADREVEAEPGTQPTLREIFGVKNPMTGKAWHRATLRFWDELADFPTTESLLPAQWSLLANAFAIHDAALRGMATPSEARLQLAKFGIAPDDLLRARVVVRTPTKPDAQAEPQEAAERKTAAQRRAEMALVQPG